MTTPLKTLLILVCVLGAQAGGLLAQPSTWNPTITGLDHTLVISENSQMMLDGEPLPPGTWIGAFFEKQDGSRQCAGMVEWQGQSTILPIYGANSNPPQGFSAGEAFHFRIWSPDLQCELDSVHVSYQSGGVFTHQGSFTNNGLSGLASLTAQTGIHMDLGVDTSLCKGDSLRLTGTCCGQFLWSTGDTSSYIDIDQPGSYWLQIRNAAGCQRTDSINIFEKDCGIDSISTAIELSDVHSQGFLLYPNPANSVLHMRAPSHEEVSVQLMRTDAKVLRRWSFKGNYTLSLNDYPSGFYVVIFQSYEQHFVSKTILIKK